MTSSADSKPKDSKFIIYWRFARPFTLLPPLLGMLSGAFSAVGAVASHRHMTRMDLLNEVWPFLLIGSLMAAALNAASNVLNQWTDLENDSINKPTRPLPAGQVTVAETIVYFTILYLISVGAAYFVTPLRGQPGIAGFFAEHECFTIATLGAIFTLIYSCPPVRTKRWAWPAQITIAIPRGCLLKVCGWSCVGTVLADVEPWFIGAVFMSFLLGASATKDFSDMKGDLAAKCYTLPVRYGVRSAAWQIAPFFIFPWLLIPLGMLLKRDFHGADGIVQSLPFLTGNVYVLSGLTAALVGYGAYTVWLILRDPEALATSENHPSWTHMYRMMMVAQFGFAAAYLI
ncbi:MAG: UbiA prenyltransferase family protein [Planctomycetes bacterium]|nr:UbiA prenyltransferase family protein [Planctomycetota bacterium]